MHCYECGSSQIRTSKFRASDISRLMVLRFPVRCRSCGERDFASLLQVSKIRKEAKARHNARMQKEQAV